MRRAAVNFCLFFTMLLLSGCVGSPREKTLVIWVTGGLRGDFLPHGEYGQTQAGGLSRIVRALELYRRPNDLLVDLGRFRYTVGISGENRRWRIRANGFLKAMTRLRYDAINVSLLDLPPWPPELSEQAKGIDLPLTSRNIGQDSLIFQDQISLREAPFRIRFVGITSGEGEFGHWIDRNVMLSNAYADSFNISVLLTDASEAVLAGLVEGIDLILWLNRGDPVVKEIGGVLALGLGEQGNCLGRVEISLPSKAKPHLLRSDVTSWSDGKPSRHHPAREALLAKLSFWCRKPELHAYLWQVPEELSPEKHAEAQRRQTGQEADQYSDLEDVHRGTPTDYAGSIRCIECHSSEHSKDLARLHLRDVSPEVQDYPIYERCLPCHATGFDDPAGFLLSWERPDLLQVGCEACHGGSYHHALKGDPPYPLKPETASCDNCHRQETWPAGHPAKLTR